MELTYTICPHCNKRVYQRQCGNCKHFIQHYRKFGNNFEKIASGHCTASPRIRQKYALSAACDQWEDDGSIAGQAERGD